MRETTAAVITTVAMLAGCTSGGPAGDQDVDTPLTESGSPLEASTPAATGCGSLTGTINHHGSVDRRDGARVELSIELDDNYFEPTCIRLDRGASFNVELENEGTTDHTFTIDALDVDELVRPDGVREIEFGVGDGGTIVFYCRFHRADGMQGALVTDA